MPCARAGPSFFFPLEKVIVPLSAICFLLHIARATLLNLYTRAPPFTHAFVPISRGLCQMYLVSEDSQCQSPTKHRRELRPTKLTYPVPQMWLLPSPWKSKARWQVLRRLFRQCTHLVSNSHPGSYMHNNQWLHFCYLGLWKWNFTPKPKLFSSKPPRWFSTDMHACISVTVSLSFTRIKQTDIMGER